MSKQKYPQASVSTTSATGTPRKGRGSYSNFHLHAKRNRKRQEAEERQIAYDKLSIQEKIKHAGNKVRAKLERRLLEEQYSKIPQTPDRLDTPKKTVKTVKTKAVKK